ncbi:MAG: hypothetical protein AAF984_04375 [Verrucomicrobiota bacterium]
MNKQISLISASLMAVFFSVNSLAASSAGDEVKEYLVSRVSKMKTASADFVKNAQKYDEKIETFGSYKKAYADDLVGVEDLVKKMQENYKAMDSFGYETVEGIVAGVPSLSHYDVYLDAGVPKSEGPEDVADVVLKLSNGEVIDRQGPSFTYIIEPALWGGDSRWIVPIDLDGDGKMVARESLPKTEVLTAVAEDTDRKVGELLSDSKAWNPTTDDLFGAMIEMTPTLSEYFEEWKESKFSEEKSGRFYAVSRVSDMKGIMSSCYVIYKAVQNEVGQKDKALNKAIIAGYDGIMSFLDALASQEVSGKLNASLIDELASQAKSRTDKLVPQIEQAYALIKS